MHLLAEHVHVVVQRLGGGKGGVLGERDGLVHLGARLLIDPRARLCVDDSLALQEIAEGGNRVALAPRATSSLERYSSGSAIEWPRKR